MSVQDWYTADQAHLLSAKKMSTWRHGDAKLEAADVVASNQYLAGQLFEPIPFATPFPSGASFIPE
jgi:hypothetical protein